MLNITFQINLITIIHDLEDFINNLINSEVSGIKCSITNGIIKYEGPAGTIFNKWSHRAGLILGLYNHEFETTLLDLMDNPLSAPILNFGNVLYLKTSLPNIARLNVQNDEMLTNIAYKVNEFIYPNLPIISNKKGEWMNIKCENLNDLTFTLCDFMLKPIICLSPIFITLEVELD
jgi:hypothetical protein